jgi:hypothetical protein
MYTEDTIRHFKDIPLVLGATPEEVKTAIARLRDEKYPRAFIIKALDEHVFSIRHMKGTFSVVGLMINTVRKAQRLERKKLEWSKPSGNPVRDRLLEVGKYNPFSPDYIGDVIERREYPKHRPRFRTWGDI